MIIKQIFNNNVILAVDSSKNEVVALGCGIAFKKKVGDAINDNKVEKTFILKQKETTEKFKILLEDIPVEHVSLSYDIIEYAKNMLDVEPNDYIYVTLTDHISYALKLDSEGIHRSNVLIWEIKKFYPKEYKIGLKALELIEDETGQTLPEDEAGSIALHLVNAQINKSLDNKNEVGKLTVMVQDILNIVKYTYNTQLDENSLNYERFVTHLRFFFKRLSKKEVVESEDGFLLEQVKIKYSQAYGCMLKVEKYLGVQLTDSEKLYLTLHIQRVTAR